MVVIYFVVDVAAKLKTPGVGDGGGSFGFFVWLPMCFYFMGITVSRQQGEITDLRSQLAELQKRTAL